MVGFPKMISSGQLHKSKKDYIIMEKLGPSLLDTIMINSQDETTMCMNLSVVIKIGIKLVKLKHFTSLSIVDWNSEEIPFNWICS